MSEIIGESVEQRGGAIRNASCAISKYARILTSDIVRFVYSPECIVCEERLEQDKVYFCQRCRDNAQDISFPLCIRCRNQITDPRMGCACNDGAAVSVLWTCGMFDGFYRAVIHAIKYHGLLPLSKTAAEILASRIRETQKMPAIDLMVPIPLHWSRHLQRGFNQSELIAEHLGALLDTEVSNKVLRRVKRTKDQTRLSAKEREANMRGAFAPTGRRELADRRILLVDDVTTTGSTLNEAAAALRQAGCRNVFAAVVAVASIN
jgi:ComF family protein